MKLLKKVSYIVFALFIMLVELSVPYKPQDNVDANSMTLRQLKAKLAEEEAELQANKNKQNQTQAEINASKKKIEQITEEKTEIAKEVDDLTSEIETLNKEIVGMNVEIEDIIKYYQISEIGDSAELEYLFSAEDFTDFIYRMAITEQLTEYNDNKIKEYNKKISENESKTKELANKRKELNNKEAELEKYISSQQTSLKKTMDGALDIEDEIKATKKQVDLYENTYKCKLDETIDECTAGKFPADTAFYRPILSGRVSSNYGKRTYKLNGRWTSDFHYGLDFSGSHGQNVYASANGVVAAIFKKTSCGGNMVYINHLVNGKKYTTGYYHLQNYTVKVGDVVSSSTVIGHQGGSPKYETWDGCSTGSHVHFTISTGNWGNEFRSYSGFIARNFNPRNVLNAPALGGSFTNRTRKY